MTKILDHKNQRKKIDGNDITPSYIFLHSHEVFLAISHKVKGLKTILLLFNVLIVLMMIPSINEITNLKVFFQNIYLEILNIFKVLCNPT